MRNFIKPFLLSFILILFSAFACYVMTFSSDYKLEQFAYSINDQRISTLNDENFSSTIVDVKQTCSKTKENVFKDAFNYFYYNEINSDIRNVVTESGCLDNYKLKLITQNDLKVKKYDPVLPGYYVSGGHYISYFLDDELNGFNSTDIRFNCDSFLYISDSFADKLVQKYDITSENPYLTLISDEDYSKLSLQFNGNITFTFCINNILYSNERYAVRTNELYGDFALFEYNESLYNKISLEFEIDLKDSPYSIKKTLKDLYSLGYTKDSYRYSFKTFDLENSKYSESSSLLNEFEKISFNKTIDILVVVVVALIFEIAFCSFILLDFLFHINKQEKKQILISELVIFGVFGLLATFLHCYLYFSLVLICMIAFTFIFFRKDFLK